jgi:hypothetical protein
MSTRSKVYVSGNRIARPLHNANPLLAGIKDGLFNEDLRAKMDAARERLLADVRRDGFDFWDSVATDKEA